MIFTKGDTDVADLKISKSSAKPKSKKWRTVAFSYVLDMTKVNVSAIYALNNNLDPRKVESCDFGWTLARSMILPFIHQRSLNVQNMPIRQKISLVLGESLEGLEVKKDSRGSQKSKQKQKQKYPRFSQSAKKCAGCKVDFR